jgi:hypothetical protein
VKVNVTKKLLVEAIDRLYSVATKGIKTEWEMANRITIEVKSNQLLLRANNGLLKAEYEVPTIDKPENGVATIDVNMARNIIKALGANDAVLEIQRKKDTLSVRDTTVAANRKRVVRMPTQAKDHNFTISKPRKGFSYTFEDVSDFTESVKLVGKYKCPMQYKLRYLMTCMHFLPEEIRFICGDGMRFAVLSRQTKAVSGLEDQGEKYLIQVDQSLNIANAVENSTEMTMTFKSPQECYIEAENVRMHLDTPKEEYIAYEKHAYRQDDAALVIDVARSEFVQIVGIAGACKDKELETEGKFHSVVVKTSPQGIELVCDEGSYNCDVDADCNFYPIDDKEEFNSAYCWDFINDVANAINKGTIRIYGIDEQGILIVEPCNIDEKDTDEHGVPKRKVDDGDGSRLIFFFAAATEDED